MKPYIIRISFFVLSLFSIIEIVHSQPLAELRTNYDSINYDVHQRQKNFTIMSMTSLNIWSISNIAYGAIAYSGSTGENRYFNEMTILFNVVNLGIGIPGLLATRKDKPSDFMSVYKNQKRLENIYLFNLGLDFGYAASGMALRAFGSTKTGEARERMMGYGSSIIMQGGYLLVHDIISYLFFRSNNKKLDIIWDNVSIHPTGTGVQINLK